ncbi:amidohydrolase family protein [Nakamurella flavida]|uniref:Amidohydrolase family protein n=1 Tax=Nakamurella flavida TaxID=363630 RepID=A0A938YLX8_9ACTN|nr:amidohydrolase family protein [Nakamurella flavida]MBM9475669.1 amidohydrolase family protein [Nakamurella flavida]MDP9778054.1 N-acetylglucosamine-6-phosphate deacetylase [Nakamurella flavida]
MLITADTVVAGGRLLRPGWVRTDGAVVVATGAGPVEPDPGGPEVALGARVVVPGFVDVHVHGGGGGSFPDGDPVGALRAVDLHRRHGTTTLLASLVTGSPGRLVAAVSALRELVADGALAGIHLEGPWISEKRCGAHPLAELRDASDQEVDALVRAGAGAVRMATLAPERSGGLRAVGRLVDAGVVVAVGHTDASYEVTRAAVDAGATVGTHLFNAMRPVHHREPGPVPALLEDDRVTVELIMDGVHLHPAVYRLVAASAGAGRIALVTDAMAAAGGGDGAFTLGDLRVEVRNGVARLPGTEVVAGSTATMPDVFGGAVRAGADDPDRALLDAVRQTSTTPAAVLGLGTVGDLVPGSSADLVVLDDGYRATAVLHRGRWVDGVG